MRLELNLPALERLIGGDTEIELALRHQIVQEFAKRHLKEIINSANYQRALEDARRLTNEAASELLNIEKIASKEAYPLASSRLKRMIQTYIDEQIPAAVEQAVTRLIDAHKHHWLQRLDDAVKKAISGQVEEAIQRGIRDRLDEARRLLDRPPQ